MPARGDNITKHKPSGLFMGRVVVETPDGPTRKTRYAKTYRECKKKVHKLQAEADGGLVLDADGLRVGEWLDSWLTSVLKPQVEAGKMAHSTYVRYEGIANNHLKPALGHRKLKDLTRAEVRRLYSHKGKALSPRSVDYLHVTLQKALSQAVRDDLLPRNVASGERPRSSRVQREANALSPAQARTLLGKASGERNEALYIVALHTGLRQGELLGLKWTDLDLDRGTLSVRRSLKVTDHGPDFGPTKNRASRRSVPLNRSAVAALKTHRTRQNEEPLGLGTLWEDHGLVFPNRVGKPTNPSNFYHREFTVLLERSGLQDQGFTFHSLRHTFATELFREGKHPKIVQSLLGHSSYKQTMDTYSHLMEGMADDAVDGLDEAFGP